MLHSFTLFKFSRHIQQSLEHSMGFSVYYQAYIINHDYLIEELSSWVLIL